MLSARITFNYHEAVEPREHCTDKLYQTVASSMLSIISSSKWQVCNAGKTSEGIYMRVLCYIDAERLIRHSNKGNKLTRHTVSSSCSKPLWYCWVIWK